jgi:hypothetical protein
VYNVRCTRIHVGACAREGSDVAVVRVGACVCMCKIEKIHYLCVCAPLFTLYTRISAYMRLVAYVCMYVCCTKRLYANIVYIKAHIRINSVSSLSYTSSLPHV